MPMWEIHFNSGLFQPFLPEECQNNPGIYGFELATWLARTLVQQGIITSYPLGEDWGWFIEYIDDHAEIMICCSSIVDVDISGTISGPIEWVISLEPHKLLFKRPNTEKLHHAQERLVHQITKALHSIDARIIDT